METVQGEARNRIWHEIVDYQEALVELDKERANIQHQIDIRLEILGEQE